MHNFPHSEYASGWYQVGWSGEFTPKSVTPMRYFDTELVAYRGEEGSLHVTDAFCPHMGAHLGYGGQVEGECIRCPFHGWMWGPDGQNVDIPYSTPRKMEIMIRQWELREVDGVALLWFGAKGEGPTWEPPRFMPDDKSYDDDFWPIYPAAAEVWHGVRFPPQVVTENSCDAAHFRYVHLAAEVPDIVGFESDGFWFRTTVALGFGADKTTTWATPNGPVNGTLINEARGIGLIATVFNSFDTTYTLTATTPIDKDTSDHRATVWVPTVRGDGSPLDENIFNRWTTQQFSQHQADFPVWENMTYIAKPPFARDEAKAFRALRQWSEKFYADA